jgi:hypothetical protein
VPGAADYLAKDKDDKKSRTKKTGNTQNQNVTGGLGQISTANVNKMASDTKGGQDSSKRQ